MIKKVKGKGFKLLITVITLFYYQLTYSFNTTLCYDVEVLIFKVGESCISYKEKDDEIIIESFMRTVNIGSMAKKVDDNGYAIAKKNGLIPKKFVFNQKEGNFKRFQSYDFEEDKIKVRETKYKDLSDIVEKEEYKIYQHNGERDPYTLALFFFKEAFVSKEGFLKLFYDDQSYQIPYQVLKDEKIKIRQKIFDTKKVLIKPIIKGKGLLKPKGNWYIWIDKSTQFPVKMSVGFIIGSVDVLLTRIEQ